MAKRNREWLKELRIEELPAIYQAIAEVVGIDTTIRLSEAIGGMYCYYPKLNIILAKKKEEYIRKHFNGANHKDLARDTGYTLRWVYKILDDKR